MKSHYCHYYFGTHSGRALQNTVYFYNCKVFKLRSYNKHHRLQCSQFEKKIDEMGHVYLEYTDFGSKTNAGDLKHLKVENKCVRQYENPADFWYVLQRIVLVIFTFVLWLMVAVVFQSSRVNLLAGIALQRSFRICVNQLVLEDERPVILVKLQVLPPCTIRTLRTNWSKNEQAIAVSKHCIITSVLHPTNSMKCPRPCCLLWRRRKMFLLSLCSCFLLWQRKGLCLHMMIVTIVMTSNHWKRS